MDNIQAGRKFLKSDLWDDWRKCATDQRKRVPFPPMEKPFPTDAQLIDLLSPQKFDFCKLPLVDAIRNRQSHREFSDAALSLDELAFLLWATQGVKEVIMNGYGTKRTVPSGGARHSFETYLFVQRVKDLVPGLYRYLPLEHKLYLVRTNPNLADQVDEATNEQGYGSAVVFVWTTIPYRCEWRYSMVAHKIIALDAGHVCQNLYLAVQAIGAGTCAIDGYDQDKLDALLGVDGVDEFAIYVAPVGKL